MDLDDYWLAVVGNLCKMQRKWARLYMILVPPSPPTGEPQSYKISFPSAASPQECSVNGYQGRADTWTGICMNFLQHNIRGTVIIVEEDNLLQPQCTCCVMMVPWAALHIRHTNITQCKKREELKRRRMSAEEVREFT